MLDEPATQPSAGAAHPHSPPAPASPELPRLLHDFAPAPGLIKSDYADFVVEEIPLYPADGKGPHTYFLIEKTGLSTLQAVHDLARALNVRRHEIGFAGQKDARAVARQWMSIEHIDPAVLSSLSIPRLQVLDVTRHRNKLRLGHLRGNHFRIKVRHPQPDDLPRLQDALAKLAQLGAPNYFGTQRFGLRGDTWLIGRAIVRGNPEQAVDQLLGCPSDDDRGDLRRARELYAQRDYRSAIRHWPPMFRTEQRVLRAMAHSTGDRRRAFRLIDKTTQTFYISAYQSHLFNRVVSARLPYGLGQLAQGDLAWRHASGAVFHLDHAPTEQPRADAFEISPTGPLFGYRMTRPTGWPGTLEANLLAAEGLTPETFQAHRLRIKGSRRPLRFQPASPVLRLGADDRGTYLELEFTLPRGCYATALLRELFVEPARNAATREPEGTEEPAD